MIAADAPIRLREIWVGSNPPAPELYRSAIIGHVNTRLVCPATKLLAGIS